MDALNKKSTETLFTIFYGGDILTMEGDCPDYIDSIVLSSKAQDGKIEYVGRLEHIPMSIKANCTWVDLKGKCVLPGFIDPHIHPSMAAVLLTTDFITPFDWNLPDRPMVKGKRTKSEYDQGNSEFEGCHKKYGQIIIIKNK